MFLMVEKTAAPGRNLHKHGTTRKLHKDRPRLSRESNPRLSCNEATVQTFNHAARTQRERKLSLKNDRDRKKDKKWARQKDKIGQKNKQERRKEYKGDKKDTKNKGRRNKTNQLK